MPREPIPSDRVVAQNRRASHDYFILETVEAGLVLAGTEVKSLRHGKASLAEAYATIERGEAWVRQKQGQPITIPKPKLSHWPIFCCAYYLNY